MASSLVLAALIGLGFGKFALHAPAMDWEDVYGQWRKAGVQKYSTWRAGFPKPVDFHGPEEEWGQLTHEEQVEAHQVCLQQQLFNFTDHVTEYRSPPFPAVRKAVDVALRKHRKTVTLVLFWGRHRYTRILWHYIIRNLRIHHGVLDEVLLLVHGRDTEENDRAQLAMVKASQKRYPGIIKTRPFCSRAFGCAFNEILVDKSKVYIKIDDDIVFVKDGAFDHLVLQQLTNPSYAFYSANIVNNPHGSPVAAFAGAYPPVTYHFKDTGVQAEPPVIVGMENTPQAWYWYYGGNIQKKAGMQAHEAFIYNAAHGKLELYNYDLWDMHMCKCAGPQLGLDICTGGFYRWSINGFVFTRAVSERLQTPVPNFDEPSVGIGWVASSPQRHSAIVGEALMVHAVYTKQRQGAPMYGQHESVLLPWYYEFARQYTARPYASPWKGNFTLLEAYHTAEWLVGESVFAHGSSAPPRPGSHPPDDGFPYLNVTAPE